MTDESKATNPTGRLVMVTAVVIAVVLGGLGLFVVVTKGQDRMTLETTRAATEARLPPMDAAAPAQTETATFALG
jgi:multisubunit Na+/H+ antiporter MnhC subunit